MVTRTVLSIHVRAADRTLLSRPADLTLSACRVAARFHLRHGAAGGAHGRAINVSVPPLSGRAARRSLRDPQSDAPPPPPAGEQSQTCLRPPRLIVLLTTALVMISSRHRPRRAGEPERDEVTQNECVQFAAKVISPSLRLSPFAGAW